jgi:enolase
VDEREQYVRYREDAKVLAAIGECVQAQAGRVTVRLPRTVADAAVAAWERDESAGPGEESRAQHALRDRAAELALIGLAVSERGRWEGEEVVIGLDVASAGAAVRAVP